MHSIKRNIWNVSGCSVGEISQSHSTIVGDSNILYILSIALNRYLEPNVQFDLNILDMGPITKLYCQIEARANQMDMLLH